MVPASSSTLRDGTFSTILVVPLVNAIDQEGHDINNYQII